jgi:hypothetical protein
MFKFKSFTEPDGTLIALVADDAVTITRPGQAPKTAGLIRYTTEGKLVYYKKGMVDALHYFRKYQAYGESEGIINQLPEDAEIRLQVKGASVYKYYRTTAKDWRRLSIRDEYGYGVQLFIPVIHLKACSKL